MAWIEVWQTLPGHRKTREMAHILGVKRVQIVGHMVTFWLWAVDNAPNGLLEVSEATIAEAAEWPRKADPFVDALLKVGFLEYDEAGRLLIHDWDEYAGRLIALQSLTKEQRRLGGQKRAANASRAGGRFTSSTPALAGETDQLELVESHQLSPATVPNRTNNPPPPNSSNGQMEAGKGPGENPPAKAQKESKARAKPVTPEFVAEMVVEFPKLDVRRIRKAFELWCIEHRQQQTQMRLYRWLQRDELKRKADLAARGESDDPKPAAKGATRTAVNPTPREQEVWAQALTHVKGHVSKANFETWFGGTVLVDMAEGSVVIVAPNATARDWLENRMGSVIGMALGMVLGEDIDLTLLFEALGE